MHKALTHKLTCHSQQNSKDCVFTTQNTVQQQYDKDCTTHFKTNTRVKREDVHKQCWIWQTEENKHSHSIKELPGKQRCQLRNRWISTRVQVRWRIAGTFTKSLSLSLSLSLARARAHTHTQTHTHTHLFTHSLWLRFWSLLAKHCRYTRLWFARRRSEQPRQTTENATIKRQTTTCLKGELSPRLDNDRTSREPSAEVY